MLRGVCYFFGIIFILGGFLFIFAHPILGFAGMILGIIMIAVGHKAGGGSWKLSPEESRKAAWYYTYGPGKRP
jgi:hypothetical protein